MPQKRAQIGNGETRRKPTAMRGDDILSVEMTRDEFQLIANIFNHPELMLKKPEWKHGDAVCEKLSKALTAQ